VSDTPSPIQSGAVPGQTREGQLGRVTARARLVAFLALVAAAAALAAPVTAGAPVVQARAYVVESSVDGRTLAARDPDEPRAMASITKLMTALVVRRATRLDDVVVVPPAATRIGESSLRLRPGQRVSVRDLLIGTLVPSANDAATALALHAGNGSLRRFVGAMNETARSLGLLHTRFVNPHGLDEPGHVSTARDVARLLRAALRDPFIRRYSGVARARLADGTVVGSTDNLIGTIPGLVGAKTGHTDEAGWSQVALARRHGVTITAAVLGEPSEAVRDRDLAALLRFGLASYRLSRVVDPTRAYARVEVGWGRDPLVLVAPRAVVRPAPTRRPLVERVVAPLVARLPVTAGARLGTVTVLDGTRVVARSPLVARRSVERPGAPGRVRYVTLRTLHHLVDLVP
jgi:D-alanyl-D-alanine carboxypeptidase (penicillin-binding protein 5/6)